MLDTLDPKSIDMLRAISENGGLATTPEIRTATGLSNSQVAYRREKLREHDLIEVQTGDPKGARTPPKSHSLTTSARSHIEAGLLELSNAPVTSDVEQLSMLVNHLRDRVDDLTETIERLDDDIRAVNSDLNARVGNRAEVREASDGANMANAMNTIQADVEQLQADVSELDERKKNKLFK